MRQRARLVMSDATRLTSGPPILDRVVPCPSAIPGGNLWGPTAEYPPELADPRRAGEAVETVRELFDPHEREIEIVDSGPLCGPMHRDRAP